MLRIVIAASLALTLTALSACNTVKGLGRDIESVGQAGERAI
jgi:entericidin A